MTYTEEQTESRNKIAAVLPAVAVELNAIRLGGRDDWRMVEEKDGDRKVIGYRLYAGDDVAILANVVWNRKSHLHVYCSFDRLGKSPLATRGYEPWDWTADKTTTSIEVKADRPAKQIAGEIARRLFPQYEAALAKAREHRDSNVRELAAREEFRKRVTKVEGVTLNNSREQEREGNDLSKYTLGSYGGKARADITRSYGIGSRGGDAAKVKLEIDELTEDEALAILKLVAKARAGK